MTTSRFCQEDKNNVYSATVLIVEWCFHCNGNFCNERFKLFSMKFKILYAYVSFYNFKGRLSNLRINKEHTPAKTLFKEAIK